jgi:arsenite-transporting ATPase
VVAKDYDYYIYDLVPLGHALYYLSMATVYDAWIDKITSLREQMQEYDQVAAQIKRDDDTLDQDAILKELYIKERIQASSRVLTDREKTAFFFVLTPEEMIIQDTLKAAELFSKFQVPLSGYIVNRVLPESLKTQEIPEFLRHRLSMQAHYLAKIQETFGGQVVAQVPELERDVTGLTMISRVADYLCG